jgi:hypothetical protein
MAEISKREKQIAWVCRILMTVDVLVIAAGYISFFQAQRQLMSPLIPKSTVYQILDDSYTMKMSLISAGLFIIGLWFYSFNKKIIAIAFFSIIIILSQILLILL